MDKLMGWLCKIFGHSMWVSTASVGFDDAGHYYIASCKRCGHAKRGEL